MKIEIKNNSNTLPFPKLMQCCDSIVLMFGIGENGLGYGISLDEFMSYETDWKINNFKDLPSDVVVELRNEVR